MSDLDWWRGASIYHVYLRSFKDSNGDGIGDLQGCIEKLPYIKTLGVDAVWISPFFKSPMDDYGYDISDYRAVDPMFGNLDDFDTLVRRAHELGLKVMIDQVLSHTSVEHAWFEESRSSRDNSKADWYVWADAKPDGSPPNNWLAIFGGVAWEWEPRRRQYYLHNFLRSQPDLNLHCPAVRQQMLDELEFWLQRGVDGVRLDAVNFCYHDANLRDNPAKPANMRAGRGFSEDNPYAYQYHYHNSTQPENLGFMEDIRGLLNRYPGTVALGEVSSEDSLATMVEYTSGGDRLHMAYSFELLIDEFSAEHIRSTVENFEKASTDSWPCWAFSNHDVMRVATRWGGDNPTPEFCKMLSVLIGSLKGSFCIYQGEELGLTEASLTYDQLQDPFGIAFWPNFKGRDGCRTPMPWLAEVAQGGFSEGAPWLPLSEQHRINAINLQHDLPASILNTFRRYMLWRKNQPALVKGDIQFIDTPPETLAFRRTSPEQTLLAAFNLSNCSQEITLKNTNIHNLLGIDGVTSGQIIRKQGAAIVLELPPFGMVLGELAEHPNMNTACS